jgi:virulence-associated protein VagC
VEFELPGSEAIISRNGNRFIIEPLPKDWFVDLLASWEPLNETFPDLARVAGAAGNRRPFLVRYSPTAEPDGRRLSFAP